MICQVRIAGLIAAALVGLCGCVHLPRQCGGPPPAALPKELADRFPPIEPTLVAIEEIQAEVHCTYQRLRIGLRQPDTSHPAPHTPAKTNHTSIELELYSPRRANGRLPVILLLPMGGGSYAIERHFARSFARRGFAVVIARRGNMAPQSKLEEIDSWMEEAVRENRAALDWIETRPELDADRIALFGISTGGIRGVLLTAVDQRIKAAVIGLAGGDLPFILTHSTEPSIERRRDAYLLEHQVTAAAFEQRLRELLRSEPNMFAPYIDCRKVLLVLAKHDRVVPIAKGRELRAALGTPETLIVPTGHYTSILAISRIKRQSVKFFRRQLEVAGRG